MNQLLEKMYPTSATIKRNDNFLTSVSNPSNDHGTSSSFTRNELADFQLQDLSLDEFTIKYKETFNK
jgi:hypothetical protein